MKTIKDFFNLSLTKEDLVLLEKKREHIIKYLQIKRRDLYLERLSQVWEDKEFIFTDKILSNIINEISWITNLLNKVWQEEQKE